MAGGELQRSPLREMAPTSERAPTPSARQEEVALPGSPLLPSKLPGNLVLFGISNRNLI